MTNANDFMYPSTHQNYDGTHDFNVNKGLSKLEYFSAKNVAAMVGSIHSEEDYQRLKKLASMQNLSVSQWIAKDAVKQSLALIAELNKTINNYE